MLQDFWRHTKGTIAPRVKLSQEGDNGIIMMKAVIDILNIRAEGGKRHRGQEGSFRKTRRVKRRRFNKSKKTQRE